MVKFKSTLSWAIGDNSVDSCKFLSVSQEKCLFDIITFVYFDIDTFVYFDIDIFVYFDIDIFVYFDIDIFVYFDIELSKYSIR